MSVLWDGRLRRQRLQRTVAIYLHIRNGLGQYAEFSLNVTVCFGLIHGGR